MPAQADPDIALRLAKAVADIYGQAAQRMLETVARRLATGIDSPGWAERKLLEILRLRDEAQRILDRLTTAGPEAVAEVIDEAYQLGSTAAAKALGIEATFGVTNERAVQALAQETVTAVTSTHGQILRSTLDAYRSVIAETSVPDVVTGTTTRRQAAQRALDRFADRGISGFTDTAGRQWQLESYVEMATRTGSAQAQVAGHLDRYVDEGHDLVIVSDAPQECRLCRPWEGRVLSIRGRTPGYPTVTQARRAGLLHANCRHSLGAYIPGLTRRMTHTADPKGDAAGQEQRRLERGIRQWKRRAAVAMDDQAKRSANAKVRQWQEALRLHVERNELKRLPAREQIRSAR
jgi:hypothetical protein